MFTPARVPKTHFPPLPCRPWPLDASPSAISPAIPPLPPYRRGLRLSPAPRALCPRWSSQLLNRAVLSDPYALNRCFSRTRVRPTRLRSACTLPCAPSALCSGLFT